MRVQNLNAGAKGSLSLVDGDEDCLDLLDEVADAFGARLLAYCILRTHIHVVAEGAAEESIALLEEAITSFARAAARRGREVPVLRGPVHTDEKTDAVEVGRSIRYVHRNALDVAGVERALEYTWCSERDFFGLRAVSRVNVDRAADILNGRHWAISGKDLAPPPLHDLAPARFAEAHPSVVLAAAADAFSLRPAAVAGRGRSDTERRARAAFLAVTNLEGYSIAAAGAAIGLQRSQAARLAAVAKEKDERALRIVRTLARDPAFARHLPRAAIREVPAPAPRARLVRRANAAAPAKAEAALARAGEEGAPVDAARAPAPAAPVVALLP